MGEDENKSSEQKVTKAPGRKQMVSLWIAVATALGSTGIPKIVEMLDSKPTVEQVQQMISRDASILTSKYNQSVELLAALQKTVHDLELSVAKMEAGCCRRTLAEPVVIPGRSPSGVTKSASPEAKLEQEQEKLEQKLKAPELLFGRQPQQQMQMAVPTAAKMGE
jgi:hypothetical protein